MRGSPQSGEHHDVERFRVVTLGWVDCCRRDQLTQVTDDRDYIVLELWLQPEDWNP